MGSACYRRWPAATMATRVYPAGKEAADLKATVAQQKTTIESLYGQLDTLQEQST